MDIAIPSYTIIVRYVEFTIFAVDNLLGQSSSFSLRWNYWASYPAKVVPISVTYPYPHWALLRYLWGTMNLIFSQNISCINIHNISCKSLIINRAFSLAGKESACKGGETWVGKMPWRA